MMKLPIRRALKNFPTSRQVPTNENLIGIAGAFGRNPGREAIYLNFSPENNDGKIPYVVSMKDVPVDALWSVNLYNADGYFEKNDSNAYSFNNITAKKDGDGGVTIHFGGDPKQSNYLPILKGWNYTVRLYLPRKEVLNGSWKFPETRPVK